jgi:pimeloyl-ACP methyl ester carboxylesterase
MLRFCALNPPLARHTALRRQIALRSGGLLVVLLATTFSPGQDAAKQGDEKSEKPLSRENVEIQTKDGVLLRGTYFRADEASKETPVIVMLADEGESRAVFDRFAKRLQSPKKDEKRPAFAILSVSLRGQGDSTKQRLPGGGTRELGDGLSRGVMTAMVYQDLEAVRGHLVDRNDDGELNLNRLVYMGVGMGAMVATNGAAMDWSMPDLHAGKQGKDVKALVLVSPPWKYKGLNMLKALRQPGVQSQVAAILMYGAEDKSAKTDAERIVKQLRQGRPKEDSPTDDSLPTVVDVPGSTPLQGTDWLKRGGARAEDLIIRFLVQHAAEPDYPWSQRRLN